MGEEQNGKPDEDDDRKTAAAQQQMQIGLQASDRRTRDMVIGNQRADCPERPQKNEQGSFFLFAGFFHGKKRERSIDQGGIERVDSHQQHASIHPAKSGQVLIPWIALRAQIEREKKESQPCSKPESGKSKVMCLHDGEIMPKFSRFVVR